MERDVSLARSFELFLVAKQILLIFSPETIHHASPRRLMCRSRHEWDLQINVVFTPSETTDSRRQDEARPLRRVRHGESRPLEDLQRCIPKRSFWERFGEHTSRVQGVNHESLSLVLIRKKWKI